MNFPSLEESIYTSIELTEASQAISYAHAKSNTGGDVLRRMFNDFKAGKLLREVNVLDPAPAVAPPRLLVYPEVPTPELTEVLGWPNFKCGPYAGLFRAAGHKIPEKAEAEQAYILNWLVKLVLKHGANWPEHGQAELAAMRQTIENAQKTQ